MKSKERQLLKIQLRKKEVWRSQCHDGNLMLFEFERRQKFYKEDEDEILNTLGYSRAFMLVGIPMRPTKHKRAPTFETRQADFLVALETSSCGLLSSLNFFR